MSRFRDKLAETEADIGAMLESLLPGTDLAEDRLFEVMRYAVLGPGKRLRPFLVVASAGLFGVPYDRALRTGAAVEMVHCYSLVHDDLPAMDNDDLRRGRPTAHVRYDEATAILAGDALLTLAFEVLAEPRTHPGAGVRLRLVRDLARAAGGHGMCGGQMLDLMIGGMDFDYGGIARMERMKTGELIGFSCRAGAILAEATAEAEGALAAFAHDLGFAFQIADDLLDAVGDESTTGKRLRKDPGQGKATLVSLLGVEAARERARMLSEQAARHLDPFGDRAGLLRDAARFVVERSA